MNKPTLAKLTTFSCLFLTISACYANSHTSLNTNKNIKNQLTQQAVAVSPQNKSLKKISVTKEVSALTKVAPNLNPKVLTVALNAYNKARSQGYDSKQIYSVIDFATPDNKKQLWIFNLKNNTLLYHTYVAHGRGSGNLNATRFSNVPNTKASSLGMYLTDNTFVGSDGLSMRLTGLSQGFNNNAYERDIVMHGAWYVGKKIVEQEDRIGRSWGCTAVPLSKIKPITSTIKNGTLIFAYGNNKNWLEHGPYAAA